MNYDNLINKLENLKNNENKFSFISEFIINHLNKINNYNINQLAKATFSSPVTIIRMCKEIGLQGYKELIIILTSFNTNKHPNNHNKLDNTLTKIKTNLDATNTLLNFEIIQKFVDYVNSNKTILLFAYGESALWMESFYSRLLRLGIKTYFNKDHENNLIFSQIIDQNFVVLALSLSGETKSVLNLVKQAKKNHAVIFTISKYLQNHLKKLGDYNLNLSYNPNDNYLITKSTRYAMLYVLDLIYEQIIASKEKYYTNILKNTFLKK
ncbi:GntR family transcriptional regulator [Spiroplasma eriocheiris]|uniref:GntR family transcriptional regulator n=2 Tax=Spiroplasma eriocheiris TaxID=315358 RepID=A0A0H3XJQ6_9MOLU|nr:putative transcription regulator [Spiroplasma eriocheiris CCTCC M 207170]AKM54096.1 GntR family transcriptional regulator [Spiroplasma eriocheiris]